MKDHKKLLGFTLVELLVVIAIIALLIGILLPVLGGARERGRIANSIGNASQIMKGIMMFSLDNRNRLPGFTDTFTPSQIEEDKVVSGKEDSPIDYIRDTKVFRSPADRGSTWAPMAADHCFLDAGVGTSYAYASEGSRGIESIEDASAGTFRITSINNSSAKVIIFEPGLAVDQDAAGVDDRDKWYTGDNKAVAGFLDGHAGILQVNGGSVNTNANGYY